MGMKQARNYENKDLMKEDRMRQSEMNVKRMERGKI